jgi:hypothetical protein
MTHFSLQSVRCLTAFAVAAALVACGGGGSGPSSSKVGALSTATSSQSNATEPSIGTISNSPGQVAVSSISLQSSTRIGRSVWQYVYQVNVTNSGGLLSDAELTLKSVGQGTTVISGQVSTGPLAAKSVSTAGTITIQQDRTYPFATDAWVWSESIVGPGFVTIGSSVPPLALAATTTIITPGGSAPNTPHQGVTQVPISNPNASMLYMGLNATGTPLLLAIGPTNVTMDVNSTAEALVAITLGAINIEGLSNDQVSAAIAGTADFDALAAAIASALSKGSSPISDRASISAVWLVASEASPSLGQVSATASSLARRRAQDQSTPPIALPLPTPVINQAPLDKVFVQSVSNSSAFINSESLLHWQANTADSSGTAISGNIDVPPVSTSLVSALLSYTSTGSIEGQATLPLAASTSILTVSQNSITHFENSALLVKDFLDLAFLAAGFNGLGSVANKSVQDCVLSSLQSSLQIPLAALANQASAPSLLDMFKNILDANTMLQVISNCGTSANVFIGNGLATQILKFANPLAQTVNAISSLVSGIETVGAMTEFINDWGAPPATVKICTSGGAILACVNSYQITPVPPLLVDDEFSVINQSTSTVVLSVPCCSAPIPPVTTFTASIGDVLRITATDDHAPCYGFNTFNITNVDTGITRVLAQGVQAAGAPPPASICGPSRPSYPAVYYDDTFLIDF